MRVLALSTLFCIGATCPLGAQQAQQDPDAIIVTGTPLSETGRSLKACIERVCPPDQDIAASLAHAENQFVAGKYKAARATLLASASRNRRFAKEYPVPVSDLLRANARVAAHLGEGEAYKIGMIDSLDVLKAAFPQGHPRVLVQRIEVGDAMAAAGRTRGAETIYLGVAREARAHGQPRLEAAAMLRGAWVWAHAAKDDPDDAGRAVRALDTVIESGNPEHRPFAEAARVMKAQVQARAGDRRAIDALIAAYVRIPPSTRPVLLYSEPVNMINLGGTEGDSLPLTQSEGPLILIGNNMRRSTPTRYESWIDVVFWVRPDGTAADVEVARRNGRDEEPWEALVTRSIKARRYAPLKLAADDPGVMRVERYTLTANFTDVTGTRLRGTDKQPRIQMIDLSVEPSRAANKGR
jgi:hypothetical protein